MRIDLEKVDATSPFIFEACCARANFTVIRWRSAPRPQSASEARAIATQGLDQAMDSTVETSMRKLATRNAVVLTVSLGLAVVCILIVAFRLLPGEAGWHLKRLHADPGHLLEIVEAAEDTPEREALLKYIQTPIGTRRLIELYARDLLDNLSLRLPEVQITYRLAGSRADICTHDATGRMIGAGRCDEIRLRVVHSLLDRVDIESVDDFVLEEYQGLQLLVRREALPGMSQRRGQPAQMTAAYVCTARAAPGTALTRGGVPGAPRLRSRAFPRSGGKKLSSAGVREALDETTPSQMKLLTSVLAGPEETRWEAARLLGTVWRKDEEILARLSEGLASAKLEELEVLLEALEPIGPGRARLVPTLTERFQLAVGEGQIDVSAVIASALGRIGPQAAGAVPALQRAIKHQDKELRRAAMQVLTRIGPPARSAIPELVATLRIRNRSLRIEALRALGSVRPGPEIVPALIDCLRHGDTLYKNRLFLVSDVLCQIGEPAVSHLIEALSHKHRTVRQGVAEALAYMGKRATDASPALETAILDPELSVRLQVAAALCSTAGPREAALKILRAALHSDDEETRDFAFHCLATLDPLPTAFVRDLLQLVRAELYTTASRQRKHGRTERLS